MGAIFDDPQPAIGSKIQNALEIPANEAVQMLHQYRTSLWRNRGAQRVQVRTKRIQFDIAIAHMDPRVCKGIGHHDTGVAWNDDFISRGQAQGADTCRKSDAPSHESEGRRTSVPR